MTDAPGTKSPIEFRELKLSHVGIANTEATQARKKTVKVADSIFSSGFRISNSESKRAESGTRTRVCEGASL